jgi:hypothetical protein
MMGVGAMLVGLAACTGSEGKSGEPGTPGPAGPAGTGTAGSAGTPGTPGTEGPQGAQGSQGPQGPQGPAGEAGASIASDGGGAAPFNGGTVTGATTFTGAVTLSGGVAIDLSSRVSKTVASTGTNFATQTIAGTNVCVTGNHPCTAWEVMVLDELSSTPPFDVQGWVVGSFPNTDYHLRSLANGQDSIVCPVNSYLTKYPSTFVNGGITTPGGLHCAPSTSSMPVWCCKNRS